MPAPNFVHLHLHTDYSLLDGACEIGELTDEAARRGMPAVAVTDHGNLFAAANFYHKATTHGVKPIIGCEVYVAPDNHKNRGAEAERSNHLVLLCENDEGYRNLIKLVSTGFLDGFYYKPRVDHELLAKHSKGLIALSACLRGEVADALMSEKYDQARSECLSPARHLRQRQFFPRSAGPGPRSRDSASIATWCALSKETGIPLVATNDCHYLTQSDAHAQEVLMCIQTGKTMSDAQRMKFATDQFYFKTAEEMAQVFRELPDARYAHGGHRRALQRENPARQQSVSGIQGSRKATPPIRISKRCRAKDLHRARRSSNGCAKEGRCGIRWTNTSGV